MRTYLRLGAREQIRAVLRGQKVTDTLVGLMHPGPEPYPDGISAIVHTRNEATRIAECLETLRGWTDEIIICDMESEDATVEIAERYTDSIIRHPRLANFDRARNCSAMRAQYRWVFYLDADERVPAPLGQALRRATAAPADAFDALLIPFRHHFAGHWMLSLYPGYTAPRLLRNGKFLFNPRLHSGAIVDGRVTAFPAHPHRPYANSNRRMGVPARHSRNIITVLDQSYRGTGVPACRRRQLHRRYRMVRPAARPQRLRRREPPPPARTGRLHYSGCHVGRSGRACGS